MRAGTLMRSPRPAVPLEERMTATPRDQPGLDSPWPACPVRPRVAADGEFARPLPPDALCAIVYRSEAVLAADPRLIVAPLPALRASCDGEIWLSRTPVSYGRDGIVDWSCNDELMVMQLRLPALDVEETEDATQRLYAELLRFTEARGFPHLLRTWSYLGRINEGEGDQERYRRFCVGRHRVIGGQPGYERRLPAATVIGMADGGLVLIAVAARRPGQQVENPVQTSAWRYPRAYGPQSPGFTRAMFAPWADGAHLLVSGTASVVGHATAHVGDAPAQLRQTMANLDVLIKQPGLARRGLLPEYFTLYLRDPADLRSLEPLLARYFANVPLQIFRGDICRRDLLLEIEGIYRVPGAVAGR
jgi:chorismate lyase/3-hydroxybenzoate synthase